MKLSRSSEIPEGHIEAKTDVKGVYMIALPESLFEIADAYERFSAAAEYLTAEFDAEGIEDLLNSDPFMQVLKTGAEGDTFKAAMDVEDEL